MAGWWETWIEIEARTGGASVPDRGHVGHQRTLSKLRIIGIGDKFLSLISLMKLIRVKEEKEVPLVYELQE